MLNIINKSNDIYFNLALEEYFLRQRNEDIFMLWQSEPSVVAGKHQNIMAEANHAFVKKNNLRLARRLTGGGTVFHGPGNINFTFIRKGESGKLVNFSQFIEPIVDFLQELGIKAEIGVRNDLLIAGKKISGNAEHIFKTRVLHHGTLLYSARLETLNESIRTNQQRYIDKAIQSNPSEVANISDYLSSEITISEFVFKLENFLMTRFTPSVSYRLSETDISEVKKLRDQKYASKEWIFGYSPDFEVKSGFTYHQEEVQFSLLVSRGFVTEVVSSGGPVNGELELIFKKIIGEYFIYENFQQLLDNFKTNDKLKDLIFKALF